MTVAGAEKQERVFTGPVVGITLLFLVFFSAYLLFFPTLPFFIKELGGAESEIGLLIGVSSLASLLVRPFVGFGVDSRGRKPVLMAGMGLFFVNCLLYNLVTQTYMLLPLRLLTGACLAMVITSASTYIADVAPPSRRGEAISYFGLANALGFAVGPALGGFVIHAGALDGFDGFFTGRFDWLAGAKTGDLHFTSLFLVAAALAVAGFLIAAALPESRPEGIQRRSRPALDDLFSRLAAFPATINFTSSFAFAAMVTFMPLFARNVGIHNAGNLFLAYAVALIVMRLTIGKQIDRVSRAAVIVPGIVCIVGALAVMAIATNVPMLFVGAGLYGVGAGAFQPAMMAYLVDQTPVAIRGRAVSTFTLGADLGLSAGSFALGIVVELVNYGIGFVTAAGIGIIGLAMFVAGWRRRAAALGTVPLPRAGEQVS
jgi:MFS family permease